MRPAGRIVAGDDPQIAQHLVDAVRFAGRDVDVVSTPGKTAIASPRSGCRSAAKLPFELQELDLLHPRALQLPAGAQAGDSTAHYHDVQPSAGRGDARSPGGCRAQEVPVRG